MSDIVITPGNGPQVPVNAFSVLDPIINFKTSHSYLIPKGGILNTYRPTPSNTFSNSNIQFQVDVPSPQIVFDRKIYLGLPVRITFTGDTGDDLVPLLNYGVLDAFRAFPLTTITQSLNITWNNSTVSQNVNDYNAALQWYQSDQWLENCDYSTFPAFQDQFADYIAGFNTARNPLGGYDNTSGAHEQPRGAFPIHVETNTRTLAVINAFIVEPIFMSPVAFGHLEVAGFYGVTNFQFTFNLDPNLARIWSHAQTAPFNFATITVTLQGVQNPAPLTNLPLLFFRYISLAPNMEPPAVNLHPFFGVQRYINETNAPLASQAITVQDSQNIQLKTIPTRIYIYARRRNADATAFTTDTYARILNVNVNWNNNNALLGSASPQDLYHMSIKNGCKMSWPQWWGRAGTGGPNPIVPLGTGTTGNTLASVGSILCVSFGDDIALNEGEAPGLMGTYQLQIRLQYQNVTDAAIQYALYIVVCTEGVFGISGNTAFQQEGILNVGTVLNAETMPKVDRNLILNMYGGNFFTGVKKFFSGIPGAIQRAAPYVRKAWQIGRAVAPFIGLGGSQPSTMRPSTIHSNLQRLAQPRSIPYPMPQQQPPAKRTRFDPPSLPQPPPPTPSRMETQEEEEEDDPLNEYQEMEDLPPELVDELMNQDYMQSDTPLPPNPQGGQVISRQQLFSRRNN